MNKIPQFRYNCLCHSSFIPSSSILFRIPTSDLYSGCNDKIISELEINEETGLEDEEKSIFCIPHYICTFRRNRTIPHSNTTSEYSFQGSMLIKEDARDHHRTIDIEDNKVLHWKALLAHG